ncbi:MAG: hypothetical protein ACE5D6_08290, partial [Candidatus Zixiibacteriota bacterium]
MRIKIESQPSFMFTTSETDLQVVTEYQEKYTKIDALLEENSKILDLVHGDLKKWGSEEGRESDFSSEQILRMILIKGIEAIPWRSLVIRVSQSNFLRNFARIGVGPVMDFTFLSRANKYIREKTWKRINELLLKVSFTGEKITGEKCRVDSTLYETNIHYPTDSHLLWDGYRVLAGLIKCCNQENPRLKTGNRFHKRKAKKLYVYISTHSNKKNKSTLRKIKRKYGELIEKVAWIHEIGVNYVDDARSLGCKSFYLEQIEFYLPSIRKVVNQARRRILDGECVPNKDKIFSIFEPHTELIKRGKAGKPIEFGHMVTIGQNEDKFITYYDVMAKRELDNTRTDVVLENHKNHFGSYPKQFTADKHYYKSMEHIYTWEE